MQECTGGFLERCGRDGLEESARQRWWRLRRSRNHAADLACSLIGHKRCGRSVPPTRKHRSRIGRCQSVKDESRRIRLTFGAVRLKAGEIKTGRLLRHYWPPV